MTKEELNRKAEVYPKKLFIGEITKYDIKQAYLAGATEATKELEAQIEKMKCLNEEIIKALKETLDYEWLHAHNGKAKYLYLQTVIDIVNEKFKEIKEK